MKVTVEGDGDLVITGAGLEEIRLRPGSYRVFADRDGKRLPLEKELVTVSRGGHEIVRVKVESPSAPTAISETGPFVLLDLRKERKFDTLAEAVQGASDGDIIEIHGNGPFVTPPITIRGRALTLRPGAGYRPVLRLSATAVKAYGTLLETDAPLALEGLELQIVGGPGPKTGRVPEITRILRSHEAPLFVAFCRFLVQGEGSGISMADAPACEVYHSEFYSTGGLWWRLGWKPPRHGGRLIVASNLFVGGGEALALWNDHADLAGASIKLVHNNFATGRAVTWFLSRLPGHGGTAGDAKTFQVHAAENLFDPTDAVFHLGQPAELPVQTQALTAEQAQALLPKWLAWTEARNVYRPNLTFLRLTVDGKEIPAQQPVKDLSAWKKLWSLPTLEALQGPLRYDRTVELPVLLAEGVRPADFRLHPDSTGKGAGIMGNDSGANVELVGPGAPTRPGSKHPRTRSGWPTRCRTASCRPRPRSVENRQRYIGLAAPLSYRPPCSALRRRLCGPFRGGFHNVAFLELDPGRVCSLVPPRTSCSVSRRPAPGRSTATASRASWSSRVSQTGKWKGRSTASHSSAPTTSIIVQVCQQLRHGGMADLMPLARKRLGQF